MPDTPGKRKAAAALSFDPAQAALPQIRAAGYGVLADAILRLAFDHGVRVREDAALAEILAAFDVDSEIPPEAIAPVAEILTYLYRANGEEEKKPAWTGSAFDSAGGIGDKDS